MHKSNVLWNLERLEDAVKCVEENQKNFPELAKIFEDLKRKYKEEYGLEYQNDTMKKIEKFVKWMNENGAKFSKIRMRYYAPDYRGVHAIKKIENGEMFLYVPQKLIITPKLGRDTKIGGLVKKSGVKLSWDYLVYITIFLLEQFHDEKSWWRPYMDVYPKMVGNFPMFYTDEEKSLLTGSPMVSHIKNELQEIKDEYNSIIAAVPEFKKFSCCLLYTSPSPRDS